MNAAGPDAPVPAPLQGGDNPGTAIALDTLKEMATRDAYATWQAARGARRMPSRADMTPRVMKKFLSVVALAEVIGGGGEFRFRVVGDQIASKQRLPLIGKTLAEVDQMVPGFGAFLKTVYRGTVEQREPLAYRGSYVRTADKHPFTYEAVILPLGDDGETPDHILVVSV